MHRYAVSIFAVLGLLAVARGLPQQQKTKRPTPVFKKTQGIELPSNATLIRENIVDTFSCEGRIYGYYADIDNECQIFHVCMPQERGSTKWSFICPSETVFNQATFVCTRTESSIPCEDSEQYYSLNEEIGKIEETEESSTNEIEEQPTSPATKFFRRGKGRRIADTTEPFEEPTITVAVSRNARLSRQ